MTLKDPDKMSNNELRREVKLLRATGAALRDDMIMRADVGTYDGDHSVQAGNSVWYAFCKALGEDDEG